MTTNRRVFLGRAATAATAAGGVAGLLPSPAGAATDPLHGPRLHQHVVDLCAFGPRRTGTEAERQASLWLADRLRGAGLDVRVDEYGFRQWVLRDWSVDLVASRPSTEVAAYPMRLATAPIWSMGSSVEGEAELVDVGFATDAELARVDVRGKIAVVDGKVLANVFATYCGIVGYAYWKLVERGAVGMLATSDAPGNLVRMLNFGDNRLDDNPIPAWTVGRRHLGMLRRLARMGGARVRFVLDASHVDGVTRDVIGDLPGGSDEALLVAAHVDSMYAGALDDATGVAGLIGLAERFAARPQRARRKRMVFAGVTGHDTGFPYLGMRHLVNANPELVRRLAAHVTLDHLAGVGAEDLPGGLRRTGLDEERLLLASNNAILFTLVTAVALKYRLFPSIPVPEPMLHANPDMEGQLVSRGVPSVNVTMAYPWYHTPEDTPEKIPPSQLRRAVMAHAELLDHLHRIPRSVLMRAERPVRTATVGGA